MNKIRTEREKDFEDVIWDDKNKIKNIMTRLSILGEKNNHNITKLSLDELFDTNPDLINTAGRKLREIIKRFNDLHSLKEVVYSGKHYVK